MALMVASLRCFSLGGGGLFQADYKCLGPVAHCPPLLQRVSHSCSFSRKQTSHRLLGRRKGRRRHAQCSANGEGGELDEDRPSSDQAEPSGRDSSASASASSSFSLGPDDRPEEPSTSASASSDFSLGPEVRPASQGSTLASGYGSRLELELSIYTGRMAALQRFKAELSRPDEEIDLLRAAAYIAQHAYTSLDPENLIAEVDQMAAELEKRLPPKDERYPMRMVRIINQYLYEDLKYTGAESDYYNVNNSCLNFVLKHKTGIPISLSLVYMELAKRVDFPMVGVNLPAHFMIRPVGDGLEFFVDAFEQGKVVFLQDAEEKLAGIYGTKVVISKKFVLNQTVSNRALLVRMLTNLKQLYFQKNNPASALAIVEYLKVAKPDAVEEVRDAGLCLYLLKRFPEATSSLEEYLKLSPRAADASAVRLVLEKMRNGAV